MKFPDASGVPANMLPISDATAFEQLKKLVDAEGLHLVDPDWMTMLAGLGIVRGEPFKPDERTRGILDRAANSKNSSPRRPRMRLPRRPRRRKPRTYAPSRASGRCARKAARVGAAFCLSGGSAFYAAETIIVTRD